MRLCAARVNKLRALGDDLVYDPRRHFYNFIERDRRKCSSSMDWSQSWSKFQPISIGECDEFVFTFKLRRSRMNYSWVEDTKTSPPSQFGNKILLFQRQRRMTRISKANKYFVASLLLLGPRSGRRTPVDLKRLRLPICSNWDRFTTRFVLLYSNFLVNRPQKRLAIKVPTKGSQRIERQAVNAFNGKAFAASWKRWKSISIVDSKQASTR